MKRIYPSPPHLDGQERELLIQVYESNWITTLSPQGDVFEKGARQKMAIEHAALFQIAEQSKRPHSIKPGREPLQNLREIVNRSLYMYSV